MADTVYEVAARAYDNLLTPPLRNVLVGRGLFQKVTMLPSDKTNYDYYSITDMGDAQIFGEGIPVDTWQIDTVKIGTTNLKIPTIGRRYQIERATFEALKGGGKAVDTAAMISAGYKVGDKIDNLLLNGWTADGTNYDIEGLYQAADNNYSTSKDFGTAGNAMAAVSGGWALLLADNVTGVNMNLTLNPVQYEELVASVLGSGAGKAEIDFIKAQLNPVQGAPTGSIYVSNNITAGTGLMSPVDPTGTYIELVVARDVQNVIGAPEFPGMSPYKAAVYARMAPLVRQLNSCCRLSSI